MTDLTREAIAAVDPQGMLGDVLAQPHQIGDALWRIESAGIGRFDLSGGLLVAGMGGSAIGGELAAAALDGRAELPVRTVRDYALEAWTGPDTLVLCASYSGDTEETLACFEQATERGIPRLALTTGGRLAERARAEGVPVIGVPAGMQPRAAVVYMVVAALECAALCGAAPSVRAELEAAEALLARLVGEWGPDAPDDSAAKSLARELHGSIPVVYGAGPTVAVAKRWKKQLNENPKLPAFWAELPELDHNEIVGLQEPSPLAGNLGLVLFRDPAGEHPRVATRFRVTEELVGSRFAWLAEVAARGTSPLARLASLLLLADLGSVYTALELGHDPTPIPSIDRLKQALANQG